MNERTYNIIRLVGLFLTVVIFAGHYFLYNRQLTVFPTLGADGKPYGYIDPITGKSDSWVNRSENSTQCDYKPQNKLGCGFLISVDKTQQQGIDLSLYESVLLDINYEGPSKFIRFYVRNFDPSYSSTDVTTTKLLSMVLNINEIGDKAINIDLTELTVAERWIKKQKSNRKHVQYQVNNVTYFGFDYVEPGLHLLRVNNIVLTGKYIKTKTLLFYTLYFWMGVFLFEGVVRFYLLYRKSQNEKSLVKKLKDNQHNLEIERERFRILSSTDPLTAISNRTGMTQYLNDLFFDPATPPNFGVLLFDIDHFKKINDTYGHDIGDEILKSFSQLMSTSIRSEDHFARWGGEEFILVTPKTTPENLMLLAEKFRKLVERQSFTLSHKLRITISIGVTLAREDDIFEETFKRADNALYSAKDNGRNCSRYEG